MPLTPRTRFVLVVVLAIAYGTLAGAVSTLETPLLLPPLSLTALVGVPLALGALASLAFASSRVAGVLVPVLVVVTTAAVGVVAELQPPAWFVVEILPWLLVATVSCVLVSFIPDGRQRGSIALIACLLPGVAGPLETRYERAETRFTETSSAEIAAPAHEVWEQVIDVQPISPDERVRSRWTRLGLPTLESAMLEEPRPGTVRNAAWSGGVLVTERVMEWEDAERFRVVARRIMPDSLLRTGSRWTAFVASGAFTPFATSYDLEAVGDSATRLRISGEYRLGTHINRYLDWWASRAVRHEQRALLAVIRRRAEAARTIPPELTAEMRHLRATTVDVLTRTYARSGDVIHAAALFVNGERRAEAPAEIPVSGPEAPAGIEDFLRTALRSHAAMARTSMWMATSFAALSDSGSAAARDSLRLEFEDWLGRCVRESTPIAYAPGRGLALGTPRRTRCTVNVMAERIRRGRVLATLPISAGDLNDHWSVAVAVRGTLRVYMDSVVVRADSVGLRATALESGTQMVDTVALGLALGGGRSWSIVRRGTGHAVGRAFAPKETWSRSRLRFSVPADSTFAVERSWPVFELIMSLPKTTDNPYGLAWTYAHAPEGFFAKVVRRLPD